MPLFLPIELEDKSHEDTGCWYNGREPCLLLCDQVNCAGLLQGHLTVCTETLKTVILRSSSSTSRMYPKIKGY